jgi:hypothetical protein
VLLDFILAGGYSRIVAARRGDTFAKSEFAKFLHNARPEKPDCRILFPIVNLPSPLVPRIGHESHGCALSMVEWSRRNYFANPRHPNVIPMEMPDDRRPVAPPGAQSSLEFRPFFDAARSRAAIIQIRPVPAIEFLCVFAGT